MTIRGDSYSSVEEVIAFTRVLLDGQDTFDATSRPTLTEVEKFIDRASSVLNVTLAGAGLVTPIANTTAKLTCDDWVTQRSAEYVEATQRGAGYSSEEGSRTAYFRNLTKSAMQFVTENRLGLIRLGVAVGHAMSEGLVFTGETAQAERSDPTNTAIEQPFFSRRQFDTDSEDEE